MKALKYKKVILGFLCILLLFYINSENFLLFHGFAEIIGIVLSATIFIIGMNVQKQVCNNYLTFLSIAYFFIAILDTLQLFSSARMGVYPDIGSSQLWVAARYFESTAFLIAPLLLTNKSKLSAVKCFMGLSLTTLLITLSILYWRVFPSYNLAFLEQSTFQQYSIYIISSILLTDLALLIYYKALLPKPLFGYMGLAIIFTLLSDILFSLPHSEHSILKTISYIFKLSALFIVYLAVTDKKIFNRSKQLPTNISGSEGELHVKIRELNCLYKLSAIVERKDITLPEVLEEIVNLIPTAWLYPEETCVRLIVHDKEYVTGYCSCFRQNNQNQRSVDILVDGKKVGAITVHCMNKNCKKECFDKHLYDQSLLQLIANFLGRIIQRYQALEKLTKYSGELETRYKQMFESNVAIKLILDPDSGKILEANKSAAEFYGYDIDTLSKMNIADINTLSLDRIKAKMNRSILENSKVYICKHKTASGVLRDVEVYSGPISIDDKVLIYAIIFDITERKKAEEELQLSQQRAHIAESVAHIGHWEYDPINDHRWWSDEVFKILSLPNDSSSKSKFELESFIHPDDKSILPQAIKDSVNSDCKFNVRFRVITQLGEVKYLHCVGINSIDDSGNTKGITGTIQDVTEHMKSIEQSESLAEIINSTSNEICIFSSETLKFIYANKSYTENTGYSIEELYSMTPSDIATDYDKNRIYELLAKLQDLKTTSLKFTTHNRRKNNTEYEVEVSLQKCRYKGESAYVGILLDVTEQNRLNSQLHQSDKMSALGQLVGGIAHDFNNILAGIVSGAEILEISNALEGYHKEVLSNILNSGMNAKKLTEQLLTFSRQTKLEMQKIDLNDITSASISILKQTLDPKIKIDLNLTPEDIVVTAPPAQLQAAIINICVNARDALIDTSKPIITITTRSIHINDDLPRDHDFFIGHNEYCALTITNNGPYIPKTLHDKIFEPFYTTKAEGKGTGLGLAMVFSTIKSCRGRLFIDSQEGQDTSFTIYLPINGTEKTLQTTEHAVISGTGKILLVDDDEIVRTTLGHALQMIGYNVTECESGVKGLEKFAKSDEKFDVIISDVQMPEMTGIDFYRLIRKQDCDIKIFMISGHIGETPLPDDVVQGIEKMLIKPISIKRLSQELSDVLNQNNN